MIPFILPWLVPSIYLTIHPWPWPQTSAAKVTAHGHRPPATAKVAKQATSFRGFWQRSMGPKLGSAKSPPGWNPKKSSCEWWWAKTGEPDVDDDDDAQRIPWKPCPEYFVGLDGRKHPIPTSWDCRVNTWILRGWFETGIGARLFLKMASGLDPGKKYERWYLSFEWCDCVRYRVNMFGFNTELVSYLITFLLTYLLTYFSWSVN